MDEKDLIKKAKAGDQFAVRFIVEHNKNLVWHLIISYNGHSHDNEDLFQEVFLRVFKNIGRFRAEARLSTWIGSIARNVCVDYLRSRNKVQHLQNIDNLNNFEGIADKHDHLIEKEEIKKMILAAINELPPAFRSVISLYHLDEMSYHDIAEITGMPEGTVKSYMSRARQILKAKLLAIVPDLTEIMEDI